MIDHIQVSTDLQRFIIRPEGGLDGLRSIEQAKAERRMTADRWCKLRWARAAEAKQAHDEADR
jgi:hypothetical protein